MRSIIQRLAVAFAALLPGAAFAQSASISAPPAAQSSRATLARDLERLARGELLQNLPPADSVTDGPRVIAPGTVVHGSVVARGPIDVAGRVEGAVVSLGSDVTVRRGAVVTGDAVTVGGHVFADSGRVDGEIRTMATLPALLGAAPVVADTRSPAQRTADAARFVASVFGILLIIALGVFVFAGRNLDEVVATIHHRFTRAFWYGILGQVMLLPALLVIVVALALSLIGILLIPFAIVAYVIAAAGLLALGFFAVARLIGGSLARSEQRTYRSQALMGLAIGIAIFFALWMIAALLSWSPLASTAVRAAALAATWAALTLGLGATLLSRAGTHRRVATATRPVELAAWQTPTPVAGVTAARRTSSVAASGSGDAR